MSRVIAIDWETYYDKEVSVKTMGYYKYARDPRATRLLVSVCDGQESWAGHPRDFNFDAIGADDTVLAHNLAFDQEEALGGQELGEFKIAGLSPFGATNWHCTANMSAYLFNMRSLAEAVEEGLGIRVSKDVRSKAKGKTEADMRREGWWDDFVKYGANDAVLCWKLWAKHAHRWPAIERRLSQMTIEQGRYGVAIDVQALNDGIALLKRVIWQSEQRLPWVERGMKAGSPIGLAEECRKVGIPVRPVAEHEGEEAVDAWLEAYSLKYPFVTALKNLGRGKKMLSTLERIKMFLRDDGTATFSLKYCGAATRRWSGDAGWNLQNPNKDALFIDTNLNFVFDRKRIAVLQEKFQAQDKAIGVFEDGIQFLDLRGLIVGRPGHKICAPDLSQIEPRVLNVLSGSERVTQLIREGYAIYEAHARETMGWTGGDLKTEDKKLYALAKARCLAVNSPILTSDGYIPIQSVTDRTRLVTRTGIFESRGHVFNGYAHTIYLRGEGYTPDHKILFAPAKADEARAISEGSETAQQFRRDCSGDSWAEVRRLVRYIGYLLADTWEKSVSIRSVSMRMLRERIRRGLAKSSHWKDEALSSLRDRGRSKDPGTAALGEGHRRIRPEDRRQVGSNDPEVLR